jgi:hypothetical protein
LAIVFNFILYLEKNERINMNEELGRAREIVIWCIAMYYIIIYRKRLSKIMSIFC